MSSVQCHSMTKVSSEPATQGHNTLKSRMSFLERKKERQKAIQKTIEGIGLLDLILMENCISDIVKSTVFRNHFDMT